ncbi:MAG: isoprenylcysteine carboxylmethyltransferase family protein [Chloroflexota bacterium]
MTALITTLFILLVPGFLLGIVPVFVIPKIPGLALPPGPWNWAAVLFWLAGVTILAWCAADFVRKGRGTPAPINPPKELVVSGLYQYIRNPMYLGALLIQVGNIVWFGTLAQVVYWFFLFIGFNLFIRTHEEPFLRKTFGARYAAYCQAVPRWIPRPKRPGC